MDHAGAQRAQLELPHGGDVLPVTLLEVGLENGDPFRHAHQVRQGVQAKAPPQSAASLGHTVFAFLHTWIYIVFTQTT